MLVILYAHSLKKSKNCSKNLTPIEIKNYSTSQTTKQDFTAVRWK